MAHVQVTTEQKNLDHETYHICIIAGDMDESNLTDLIEPLHKLLESNSTLIMLDVSKLEFLNSKVIGELAAYTSTAADQEKKLAFLSPHEGIVDILDLCGLTQIIPVFNSEKEAATAYQNQEL